MSHVVIITKQISETGNADTVAAQSRAGYTFEFAPSHDLPEEVINQRIAKIRHALEKLHQAVCAGVNDEED